MHLTNYAVQKHSDQFVDNEDSGTKRYSQLLHYDTFVNNRRGSQGSQALFELK